MTPFNASALLAILLAFYPTVSRAELARARRERPEYFAGGTLLGSKGDKLQLPDGRIFDLIQSAGGPPGSQRWQVIEAGPSVDEPFPLEPGPLVPLDLDDTFPPRAHEDTFESLASSRLAELDGSDRLLDVARSSLVDATDRAERVVGRGSELDDAGGAVDEVARARSAEAVADILASADGVGTAVNTTDNDYDEPPPQPQLPNEPELPAGPPPDDGSGGAPGREDPQKKPLPGDDDDKRRRTPNDGPDSEV